MKKLLVLFLSILVFSSCDLESDNPSYHLEVLPVVSYEIPGTFVKGETYPIKLWYRLPTTCHGFNGIYYQKDATTTRTIGIHSYVLDRNDCQPLSDELEPIVATFNFMVTSTGSYLFKFYKGKDEEGNPVFESVEIPVLDN
jgi:hypothetical protein